MMDTQKEKVSVIAWDAGAGFETATTEEREPYGIVIRIRAGQATATVREKLHEMADRLDSVSVIGQENPFPNSKVADDIGNGHPFQ